MNVKFLYETRSKWNLMDIEGAYMCTNKKNNVDLCT